MHPLRIAVLTCNYEHVTVLGAMAVVVERLGGGVNRLAARFTFVPPPSVSSGFRLRRQRFGSHPGATAPSTHPRPCSALQDQRARPKHPVSDEASVPPLAPTKNTGIATFLGSTVFSHITTLLQRPRGSQCKAVYRRDTHGPKRKTFIANPQEVFTYKIKTQEPLIGRRVRSWR